MLHSKLYFGYKYVMLIAAVKCRGDNEATMDSHNDRLLGAFQLVRNIYFQMLEKEMASLI